VLGREPGHGEVALEVDPHDGVPLVLLARHDHAVAHEAGVVHDHVEAPEGLDRRRHQGAGAVPVGDVVAVGDRGAAGGDDLVHDGLGGGGRRVAAVERHADVVHHYLGALAGELEGVTPADAPPGAGHDHDPAVADAAHHRA
jgi:hypothetical protein